MRIIRKKNQKANLLYRFFHTSPLSQYITKLLSSFWSLPSTPVSSPGISRTTQSTGNPKHATISTFPLLLTQAFPLCLPD